MNKCQSCGKKIAYSTFHYGNKHCLSCANKGENNPMHKTGIYLRPNYCIDCNVEIKNKYAKRCIRCAGKKLSIKMQGNKNRLTHGQTIIKHYCQDCGTELVNFRGQRCKSCSHKGELGSNWQGGISKLPYPFEFNEELKESIRKRDNYTCQNCDMTEEEHIIVYGSKLIIHHIDYNKQNCNEDNLISLCDGCNLRANWNRDYWKSIYQDKLLRKVKD